MTKSIIFITGVIIANLLAISVIAAGLVLDRKIKELDVDIKKSGGNENE